MTAKIRARFDEFGREDAESEGAHNDGLGAW